MTKKLCHYCGTAIPATASVCPTCKFNQSRWRNNLLFVGGLGGFAALVASAMAFVIDRTNEVYKNVHWTDKVTIIDFRTGPAEGSNVYPQFSSVVLNSGDGPIFVSDFLIFWRGGNIQYFVNKLIQPNDFAIVHDPKLNYGRYSVVASNNTGEPTEEILKNTWFVDLGNPQKPQCFLAIVYSKDNVDLKRMEPYYRSINRKLVSEPVDAYVEYFSSRTKEKTQTKFPAVVVFGVASDGQCQNMN